MLKGLQSCCHNHTWGVMSVKKGLLVKSCWVSRKSDDVVQDQRISQERKVGSSQAPRMVADAWNGCMER